ncbi:MAG: c-type cytochrome, partial [Alphaproteobacteria bacterium]
SILVAGAIVSLSGNEEEEPQIAIGRAIYEDNCAACHGANLAGQPDWQTPLPNGRLPAPPHDATGHTWHHSDDELFALVKNGIGALVPGYQSDMPPYEDTLSDHQIRAVLAFIKSEWPSAEREYQAARTAAQP